MQRVAILIARWLVGREHFELIATLFLNVMEELQKMMGMLSI